MNFYVCNHQHKGKPFFDALKSQGHKPVARIADISLFDRDIYIQTPNHVLAQVQLQIDRGSLILIYPHSALPPWWYDGLIKIQPYVTCVFVVGEGQKEAMKIIEPSARVEVSGWPWSQVKKFQKPEKLKRILFAPIHPSGGRLRPEAVAANKAIFNNLKRVARRTGCEIVVRYLSDLERQGLHPYSRFEWIKGVPNGSTKEIDEADVVIGEGTFLYMAVARGKPVIGINQHLPVRANKMCEKYTPHNWDKYGPDLAYPINFEPGKLQEKIDQAIECEQTEWRKRFIGDSMDPFKFSKLVERIWRESKA